jgi:hypothetical protein
MHGKSLSSLRTANSEALERLGTGGWDVVQRLDSGSTRSRMTNQSEGQYTDLGEDEPHGQQWRDVTSPTMVPYTDSPMEERRPRAQSTSTVVHSPLMGPRPIPPPKDTAPAELGIRIPTPTITTPTRPRSPSSPTDPPVSPRRAKYGFAPKQTLYVANPNQRGTTDS